MDALDQQGRPADRRDGRKREKREEEESSEDAELGIGRVGWRSGGWVGGMQSGEWAGGCRVGDGWGGMERGMGGVGWRSGGWAGWDAEWGMDGGCRGGWVGWDAEVGNGRGGMEREAERVSAAGEWLGRVYIRKKNVKRTEMVSGQVHCTWGLDSGVTGPLLLSLH